MSELFTPVSLGQVELKNRIVMAPLTRGRAGVERIPNDLMREYYCQRASAGLIISEATSISVQGLGWQQSPGIYNDQQVAGWKKITAALHELGTPMLLQLWHCGRASHTDFHPEIGLPVAPSAIAIEGEARTPNGKQPYEIPRALETSEIPLIVEDYRQAATRAKAAGFDGVEVHSANGYLLDQFLQSKTNTREDEYGGSIENRFRLLKEVVTAVTDIWGEGRVGVRLAPNGNFNDMGSPEYRELFTYVLSELNKFPLAYAHIMDGLAFGFHKLGEPFTLEEASKVFAKPLMGNCGYDQELAESAISSGSADAIAFGRPFISNPDLPERFKNNWPLEDEAPVSVWYSFEKEGYTTYSAYSPSSQENRTTERRV